MRKTLSVFTLLSLLSVGMASAQTQARSEAQAEKDQPAPQATSQLKQTEKRSPQGTHTVSYKERTRYDFDDEDVRGEMVRPDGDRVDGRLGARFESMLKIRGSFQQEMLKSVDSL
jgi:hypothetical protein